MLKLGNAKFHCQKQGGAVDAGRRTVVFLWRPSEVLDTLSVSTRRGPADVGHRHYALQA